MNHATILSGNCFRIRCYTGEACSIASSQYRSCKLHAGAVHGMNDYAALSVDLTFLSATSETTAPQAMR